ncbi:histidinol dehydrogenase [Dethiosulfovibrio peptidovorans DSM 11002]|uniref:Histidinol dehydrogenase n=1 Tax=Dethiosulfovibrio peptidovorans DSM 11002 TaxID=469381 RepID=D2Z7Y4_9BACT|nr:histidinol dehydrogenase [Dethiosulfovibrio peptidovorans]EFC91581.1 histidinol dehydrogenase [Dethiosulfovibrio peptidovorans DSM 11002]
MYHVKEALPKRPEGKGELTSSVAAIVETIRERGDSALLEYGHRFDLSSRSSFRITDEEIQAAIEEVDTSLLDHIKTAAHNIRAFAERQKETLTDLPEQELSPGVFLGHRAIPVESCGCYVPGGGYPLFSTALMLAIPASVAGVKRIVACSPVMKGTDKIHPATLSALSIAGVDEIYAVGGAQAIAAMAFGTEQIAPVDVIAGPGNRYVTEAKRQCYGQVGIDFVAGPSEVLIIADESANPEILAADILAQSEHDLNARGILLCTDEDIAKATASAVERQLKDLATAEMAGRAWRENGEIIIVDSLEQACEISNRYAPEHLELVVQDPETLIPALTNYGALFIGEMSAEVFGDYVSGSNHTLPTLRASRYTGGVWVGTFTKICTSQRMTPEGVARLAPVAEAMAKAEGLEAHGKAASIRLKNK